MNHVTHGPTTQLSPTMTFENPKVRYLLLTQNTTIENNHIYHIKFFILRVWTTVVDMAIFNGSVLS